jgi:chromosome segregation ATPase
MNEINDFGDRIARAREDSAHPEQAFADLLGNGNGSQGFDSREVLEALDRARAATLSLAEREDRLEERVQELHELETRLKSEWAAATARDDSIAALERAQVEATASLAARETQIEQREAEVRHREEAAARWFTELTEAHRVIASRESRQTGPSQQAVDDALARRAATYTA